MGKVTQVFPLSHAQSLVLGIRRRMSQELLKEALEPAALEKRLGTDLGGEMVFGGPKNLGMGQNLSTRNWPKAGFSPWLHLVLAIFWYLLLTHSYYMSVSFLDPQTGSWFWCPLKSATSLLSRRFGPSVWISSQSLAQRGVDMDFFQSQRDSCGARTKSGPKGLFPL